MPVFIDCETTGLDPRRHEVWELALIADGREHIWQLPVDESKADPKALQIGRYNERRRTPDDPRAVAEAVAAMTRRHHLAGSGPWFDAAFLGALLERFDMKPPWAYRLIDVEALMAGALHARSPWDVEAMSVALGVPVAPERHGALSDARWARDVYEAIIQPARRNGGRRR
jgi:hypothetical protein